MLRKLKTKLKNRNFLQKYFEISKIKRSSYYKVYFPKLHMRAYFRTKLQVFNVILTSFRQEWVILPSSPRHTHTPKTKRLKKSILIRVKRLSSGNYNHKFSYYDSKTFMIQK